MQQIGGKQKQKSIKKGEDLSKHSLKEKNQQPRFY